MSDQTELSDGRLACTDFAKQDGTSATVALTRTTPPHRFQSWVVSEFAAQYLCPKQYPHALTDLRTALVMAERSYGRRPFGMRSFCPHWPRVFSCTWSPVASTIWPPPT